MSQTLKDKWISGLQRSFTNKQAMNANLISFLNHRDIFDINDLKKNLPHVQNLSYDKNPSVTILNKMDKRK